MSATPVKEFIFDKITAHLQDSCRFAAWKAFEKEDSIIGLFDKDFLIGIDSIFQGFCEYFKKTS